MGCCTTIDEYDMMAHALGSDVLLFFWKDLEMISDSKPWFSRHCNLTPKSNVMGFMKRALLYECKPHPLDTVLLQQTSP